MSLLFIWLAFGRLAPVWAQTYAPVLAPVGAPLSALASPAAAAASLALPASPVAGPGILLPGLALGLPRVVLEPAHPALGLGPAARVLEERPIQASLSLAARETSRGPLAVEIDPARAFFDGAATAKKGEVSGVATRARASPATLHPRARASVSYLKTKSPADAVWLDDVLAEARRSPAAVRVLRDVEKLFAKRGKPMPVEFRSMGRDLAEFDYLHGVILISHKVRREGLANAAGTLVHELLHVLQHAQGMPAEALEMELEAHVLTLDILRELGVPLEQDPFSKEAHRRLLKSPGDFIDWLQGQLPSKFRLLKSSVEDCDSVLEEQGDEIEERLDDLRDRLAADPASARLKARLAEAESLRDWIQSDRDLLASAEGRQRYRNFSRRVMAVLERYHARRGH
ncbi:MAG: hypothetical protein NTX64_14865 [Elusimicrobia bacterium]|nr:hypothetical protein [Elusimicrobiota bacterium]